MNRCSKIASELEEIRRDLRRLAASTKSNSKRGSESLSNSSRKSVLADMKSTAKKFNPKTEAATKVKSISSEEKANKLRYAVGAKIIKGYQLDKGKYEDLVDSIKGKSANDVKNKLYSEMLKDVGKYIETSLKSVKPVDINVDELDTSDLVKRFENEMIAASAAHYKSDPTVKASFDSAVASYKEEVGKQMAVALTSRIGRIPPEVIEGLSDVIMSKSTFLKVVEELFKSVDARFK